MRISDWSSDVCSSDLIGLADAGLGDVKQRLAVADGNAGERRVSGDCGEVEPLEPFEDNLARAVHDTGKADIYTIRAGLLDHRRTQIERSAFVACNEAVESLTVAFHAHPPIAWAMGADIDCGSRFAADDAAIVRTQRDVAARGLP